MGIFSFFSKKESSFESFYESLNKRPYSYELEKDSEQEILSWTEEKKVHLIIDVFKQVKKINRKEDNDWRRNSTYSLLSSFLAKRKIQYGDKLIEILNLILDDLKQFEVNKSKNQDFGGFFLVVYKPILTNILRFQTIETIEEKQLLVQIKAGLEFFDKNNYNNETKKTIQKIEQVLFEEENQSNSEVKVKPTYFIGDDGFKDFGNELIDKLKEEDKNIFFTLLGNAQKASGSKPSKKYLTDSKKIIDELGSDQFKRIIHDLFEFLIGFKETIVENKHVYNGREYTYNSIVFLDSYNSDALKGLVWMASLFHDNKTIQTLGKLAERCFRKIPDKGQAASALGNACLFALYQSKGLDGIAQLSKLKLKVKQNSTINLIEKYIEEAAKKLGITPTEVEDLAVDDYKLVDYKIEQSFDSFKAVLELQSIGKSTLKWFKEDGKEQKTVPQFVKDKFSDKLKKLKDKQKQIDQTTSVQKERFDRMLRSNRVLSIEYFKEKYLNHGLLSFVVNKVIFEFSNEQDVKQAIFIKQKWIGLDYKEVDINQFKHVTLWHPVTSSTEQVKEWRQFLMDSEIQQPFKQAYREIYLLTDAEINTRTYSNRMASHILKQHQYVTLAKGRNWKAQLIGAWDGGDEDTAVLLMPDFNLKVEYWVNALNANDEFNDTGIWNYVTTDQIRFVNTETHQVIELVDVPIIAFSEAMRDVDLFVGVASVGNDPTWSDSGGLPIYRDYWQSYSFGDLTEVAKNRKEILQNIIPRLKISKIASVSDKFVIVKGKIRTYKIHIGSTNILMEPNDQYLCIVPNRSKKNETENLFLPFEGDTGLSVIISKAFLLADDDKITDTTITSQINR
jgi:hypothetical protein